MENVVLTTTNDPNKTISLDEEEEDEDNLLVNDFVSRVSQSLVQIPQMSNFSMGFPEERLAYLIEENASMKIDVERNLEKLR